MLIWWSWQNTNNLVENIFQNNMDTGCSINVNSKIITSPHWRSLQMLGSCWLNIWSRLLLLLLLLKHTADECKRLMQPMIMRCGGRSCYGLNAAAMHATHAGCCCCHEGCAWWVLLLLVAAANGCCAYAGCCCCGFLLPMNGWDQTKIQDERRIRDLSSSFTTLVQWNKARSLLRSSFAGPSIWNGRWNDMVCQTVNIEMVWNCRQLMVGDGMPGSRYWNGMELQAADGWRWYGTQQMLCWDLRSSSA